MNSKSSTPSFDDEDQTDENSFGYEDGISQPAVKGVDPEPVPQQGSIRQGIVLCGREGDPNPNRPAWTKDGSFMCFRKLKQDVPAWNKMLVDVSNVIGTHSQLLGARLIGRWKSGESFPPLPSLHRKY